MLASANAAPPRSTSGKDFGSLQRAIVQAWLNDQGLIDYRDDRFAIGRIGLWTKTDSVTAFDELMVVPLDDN
jgi:hypothetical protein